jgi:transposase
MVADDGVRFVVGVDPHVDSHAVAVVDAASRGMESAITIAATRRGYQDALDHADQYAPGARVWAVEGSGSYGAGLAMFLAERGERVVEVERPARNGSRSARLKSDALDAQRAAHHVLSGGGATPRLAANTQALRVLVSTRDGAIRARTAAINELRALLVTAPPSLRERLQGRTQAKLVAACGTLRCHSPQDAHYQASVLALRLLAGRIKHLTQEADTLQAQITRQVATLAPALLARPGVGPITAAMILIAWSHPGRVRNEAAFARLAGVAPIPASSGKTTRHRLDRGGDRHLNRALHTIALSQRRTDPDTQAFINHQTAQGKTPREATRSLKRYLARSIYRHLEATITT